MLGKCNQYVDGRKMSQDYFQELVEVVKKYVHLPFEDKTKDKFQTKESNEEDP